MSRRSPRPVARARGKAVTKKSPPTTTPVRPSARRLNPPRGIVAIIKTRTVPSRESAHPRIITHLQSTGEGRARAWGSVVRWRFEDLGDQLTRNGAKGKARYGLRGTRGGWRAEADGMAPEGEGGRNGRREC